MARKSKPCPLCNMRPAYDNNRYCFDCSKYMRLEMKKAGYLTPKPYEKHRGAEERENIRETKYGRD